MSRTHAPIGASGSNQYGTVGTPTGRHDARSDNNRGLRDAAHVLAGGDESSDPALAPMPDPQMLYASPDESPFVQRSKAKRSSDFPMSDLDAQRGTRQRPPDVPAAPLPTSERWDRLRVKPDEREALESSGVSVTYAEACVGARITDHADWSALAASGVASELGSPTSMWGYRKWDIDTPADMAAYASAGVQPVDAWRFRSNGITDPQASALFARNGVNSLDARWALDSGWTPEDTVTLSRAGLSGLDARAAAEAGARTAAEAIQITKPRWRERFSRRAPRRLSLQPA